MAPELRKRKSVSDVKSNGTPVKADKAVKGKRKAAEESSPVTLKKQKSVKKAVVKAAPVEKSAQKGKKPVEKVTVVEEETLEIPDVSSGDEEEEEVSKEAQALVKQVDSDDEDMTTGDSVFEPGTDVGKIPKVSKKVKDDAKSSSQEPGVLYIGRIPHGFYEHEMKQYFEQFGPINKLRLSRNKKTGASKHFAFVEFAEASTAEIVSKTMDNYLLFGHILKCRVIPKEQVHDNLFKGANKRFKKVPWNKMAGHKLQKPLTESAWAGKVTKEQNKRAKKAEKLKEIGYDFEAPDIKDVPAAPAIEATKVEVKVIEDAPAVVVEETTTIVEEPVVAEEKEVEAEAEAEKPKPAPKAKGKGAKAAKGAKGKKSKA